MSAAAEGLNRPIVWLKYSAAIAGGPPRPYAWLEMAQLDGSPGGRVRGLIDTGADTSVMPLDYAVLIGYGPDTLRATEVHGVGGTVDAYTAIEPCRAVVVGLEDIVFEMRPTFMAGPDVLWGRADFMQVFGIVLAESLQQVGLLLPEER